MSLISDVKSDIKAAQKIWLPWQVLLPWGAFCLLVFLLLKHFGKYGMALPALSCIVVFSFLVYLKWNLSRKLWFWITLSALAVIHAALIWYIPWTSRWVPSLAIAFVVSLDICLMLWILALIAKFSEGRASR